MQALAVLLGLFLVAFAGFALFNDDPLGGEPIARIALRQTPAAGDESRHGGRTADAASRRATADGQAAPPPAEQQDRHHHRRLERRAPGRRDRPATRADKADSRRRAGR